MSRKGHDRQPGVTWPDGKRFAFTIFDDPDSQTLETGHRVYGLLAELGFRTTKGVWPIRGLGTPSDHGGTCEEPEYRAWVQELQAQGFEVGYHNATSHTSVRQETIRGLDAFAQQFGRNPLVMSQHYYCEESVYWGDLRVTGIHRALYNALTLRRNRGQSHGHVLNHPYFWGDLCRERIKYVRSFVFDDVNTLRACPFFPYHDPLRPYVNYWYASSEGAEPRSFCERISEANQDRLEEEGGACIMYTHLGGFADRGKPDERFAALMKRLSRKNGWFVPVSAVLDHLLAQRPDPILTNRQRRQLERRWLYHKARFGSA
jgi:hypothetical protein